MHKSKILNIRKKYEHNNNKNTKKYPLRNFQKS